MKFLEDSKRLKKNQMITSLFKGSPITASELLNNRLEYYKLNEENEKLFANLYNRNGYLFYLILKRAIDEKRATA